jgi:hypothetical protein
VKPAKSGPFSSAGVRLDGKTAKVRTTSTSSFNAHAETPTTGRPTNVEELPDVVVDESYRPGTLEFTRYNYKNLSTLKQDILESKEGGPVTKAWPENSSAAWHRLR